MKEIPFTIASYDKFIAEKKLMASKCVKCSALWLPPRPICLTCKSDALEWIELNGKGKLVAFTVIGYCSGIVELEEGPRISAQILGVDVAHPENIKIGTSLTATFVERGSWHFVEELAKVKKTYLAFQA
jgi:uncharacterized OB-fold protein